MGEVAIFEARNRLTALVAEVEAGAEFVITRRGLPVARLTSVGAGHDHARARLAAEGLKAASRGVTLGEGLTIKDLVREGRR